MILRFKVVSDREILCFFVEENSTILSLACDALVAVDIKECKPFKILINNKCYDWDCENIIDKLSDFSLKIGDVIFLISDDWSFKIILDGFIEEKGNVFSYPLLDTDDSNIDIYRFKCMDMKNGFNKMLNNEGKLLMEMKIEREKEKIKN